MINLKHSLVFVAQLLLFIKLITCNVQSTADSPHFHIKTPAELIGLNNCSYVFMKGVHQYRQDWEWLMMDRQTDAFWPINATKGNVHIDTFTNNVDEMVFTAYNRFTGQRFIQFVNLADNTHYNLTFPEFSFAFYNDSKVILAGLDYPNYKLLTGNLKLNNFSSMTQKLPTLSVKPINYANCQSLSCFWMMEEGSIMKFPMQPPISSQPTFHRLKNDSITQFKFGKNNDGTTRLYSAHQSGMVLEWIIQADESIKPVRATNGYYGQIIYQLTVLGYPGNSYLNLVTASDKMAVLYLETNEIVSAKLFAFSINGMNNTQTYNCGRSLQVAFFPRNVQLIGRSSYFLEYSPSIEDASIKQEISPLYEIQCWKHKINAIQTSVGQFQVEWQWQCGNNNTNITNCLLSSISDTNICIKCVENYSLTTEGDCIEFKNQTNQELENNITSNNSVSVNQTQEFNQTLIINSTDIINSSQIYVNDTQDDNPDFNQTNVNNTFINETILNEKIGNETGILNQTIQKNSTNATNNQQQEIGNGTLVNQTLITNITNLNNTDDNNTQNSSFVDISDNFQSDQIIQDSNFQQNVQQNDQKAFNESSANEDLQQADIDILIQEELDLLPIGMANFYHILKTPTIYVNTPFTYVKSIVQFTLLAYIIHTLISFWVIASLYYFLPNQTHFTKKILLIMWKAYNTELLSLLPVELEINLPKLNFQESKLIYGDVVISNDFLAFAFDPFLIMFITMVNLIIIKAIRCCLKETCMKMTKLKWLKFDLYEGISNNFIELLPVLFLPCTNFLFAQYFTNISQKVNLLLFSAFGAIGMVYPFIYYCRLINSKKKKRNNNSAHKTNRKIKQNNNSEFQSLLCNILHITAPVTVLLSNQWIFLIGNGIIIFVSFLNAFRVKKQKINQIIHRFYYVVFHASFCVMHYFEDGQESLYAGFVAFCVIVVYLAHEILELIYRIGLFLFLCYQDCSKANFVANDDQQASKSSKQDKSQKGVNFGSKKIISFSQYSSMMNDKQKGQQKLNRQEYDKMFPMAKVLTSIIKERRANFHRKISNRQKQKKQLQAKNNKTRRKFPRKRMNYLLQNQGYKIEEIIEQMEQQDREIPEIIEINDIRLANILKKEEKFRNQGID